MTYLLNFLLFSFSPLSCKLSLSFCLSRLNLIRQSPFITSCGLHLDKSFLKLKFASVLCSNFSVSVYEIMWCDHSNETSVAVLSHVAWDQARSGGKGKKRGQIGKISVGSKLSRSLCLRSYFISNSNIFLQKRHNELTLTSVMTWCVDISMTS